MQRHRGLTIENLVRNTFLVQRTSFELVPRNTHGVAGNSEHRRRGSRLQMACSLVIVRGINGDGIAETGPQKRNSEIGILFEL